MAKLKAIPNKSIPLDFTHKVDYLKPWVYSVSVPNPLFVYCPLLQSESNRTSQNEPILDFDFYPLRVVKGDSIWVELQMRLQTATRVTVIEGVAR